MVKIIRIIILTIIVLSIIAYFFSNHYYNKVISDTHPQTVLITLDYLEADKKILELRGDFKGYSFNHEKPFPSDITDTVTINMEGSKNKLLVKSFLKKEEDIWKIDNIEYSIIK